MTSSTDAWNVSALVLWTDADLDNVTNVQLTIVPWKRLVARCWAARMFVAENDDDVNDHRLLSRGLAARCTDN